MSSPHLCGCRLLPRIYSPTLQQSTHAPASLIRQPQEAAFGILPSETSVIVTATPGRARTNCWSWKRRDYALDLWPNSRRTAPIIAYNRELENIVKDTYKGGIKKTHVTRLDGLRAVSGQLQLAGPKVRREAAG